MISRTKFETGADIWFAGKISSSSKALPIWLRRDDIVSFMNGEAPIFSGIVRIFLL